MSISENIQRILQILRPPQPGASTDATRAHQRHRRALLASVSSIAARATSMGASLITIPLTLHYLGTERFGLWMTISSIVAMASFADFGIGNGVLNTVAEACGRDDVDGIRRAISSGVTILAGIGAALLAAFLLIYPFIHWANLFRVVSAQGRAEAGPAIFAFALCFALNIPLDIVQRVQMGLQEGYRTNIWQLCASAMSLVGIVACIHLHLGVPALVLSFAGAPVLGALLNSLYFFGISRRDLLPRWHLASRGMVQRITNLGVLFFLVQLVVAISFSGDNFIIAHMLGAASVPVFSVPQRIFSLITVLTSVLVAPLWPAYGEAIARGDMDWVHRTLTRTLIIVFSMTVAVSFALVLLAPRLLLLWVGPGIHPSLLLMFGLAALTVVQSLSGTMQAFLNGAGAMRFQATIHGVFLFACLGLKLWLVRRYGAAGVPWATVTTYTLLIVVPSALYMPGVLRRLKRHPELMQTAESEALQAEAGAQLL